MLSYPSGMTVSNRALIMLADVLCQRRSQIGTRWRGLDARGQGLLAVPGRVTRTPHVPISGVTSMSCGQGAEPTPDAVMACELGAPVTEAPPERKDGYGLHPTEGIRRVSASA